MAQFDVYENPSRQTRKAYPYILDLQHSLIESIATRIVVPLGEAVNFRNEELKGITPRVEFEGRFFLILMPQMASINANILSEPIGTLTHLREEIISTLDLIVTGI